jgi:hypothetical protein
MTLDQAAALNWIVKVWCNGCRRTTYYLASDLAEVFGGKLFAFDPPPISCSRCKTDEMLHAEAGSPRDGDWGNLQVRRPGPVRHTQTWRTVRLGDQ